MKLIVEQNWEVSKYNDGPKNSKNLFINGIFMQSEVKNRNGRIYPSNILDREVTKYIQEKVNHNKALGELNHPTSPKINPDRVCHRIVSLEKDGNNWIGKSLILNTPCGNIVKGLIEGGASIGVSSRGIGSLNQKEDVNYVMDDYMLCCVDVVVDPSAPDAYINGIMENVEWIFENNKLIAIQADKSKEIIKETSKNKLDEVKIEEYVKFINLLTKGIKYSLN